ncbi:MAG: SAM-dependent methyltransferase [bacterium]
MKTQTLTYDKSSEKNNVEIVQFYEEATEDYEFWSNDFNMHFGYFVPFKTNPFKRDSMLNQLNSQVLKRLNIGNKKSRLIDLGCGMGATMRYALSEYKNLTSYGVTLSDFQVTHGNKLLENQNGIILKENYNNTSFQPKTFDAAVAIESFCHSGHQKSSLQEAYRILKKGGQLVISDCFLRKEKRTLCKGGLWAYNSLCDHWSLEKLETQETMKRQLEAVGFKNIKVEDISFKVAPSVLHVPFAILGFIIKRLLSFKPISKASLHNLKGSFFALLAGLHLKSFGYFLITASKE